MSDEAEFWFNKGMRSYTGLDYFHIPGYNCGHKHWYEARFIDEVNCKSCKDALETGVTHSLGTIEEHIAYDLKKSNERDKKTRKKARKRLPNNPVCPSCHYPMVERTNGTNGNRFYGCSQFPKCKHTSSITPPGKETGE